MAKVRLQMEKKEQVVEEKAAAYVPEVRNKIAQLLLQAGKVTQEQLEYAQRVHAKLTSQSSLLSVLEELQYVTRDSVRETLQANPVSVPLGSLLVECGYLSEANLATALARQEENKSIKFGQLVVDLNFIEENDLLKVLSYQLGFPFVDPALFEVDPHLMDRATIELCRDNRLLPLEQREDGVLVAFADPLSRGNVKCAQGIWGESVIVAIARQRSIYEALNKLEVATGKKKKGAILAEPSDNVIVQAVNEILIEARRQAASDIHIEPHPDTLSVRFRKDGVLQLYREFPADMAAGITSRIKIMAGADIAERRRHQDGRIFFDEQGIKVDLRVSIYATIHGEKIVMRILSTQSELLSIHDLGMAPRIQQRFQEEALDAPSGVIIITGPTGSGKTSTLYSAVNRLNKPDCSIITAEDPVEFVLDGIAQCSINPKINVTFQETLKHMVRQDPDIIVIGEIRDKFSAEMAIEAALTGHKVLTTFHTEDSTGVLLRLLDMQIEAFLIASTVQAILAQRLVRRVCSSCKQQHPLTPDEIRRLGYSATREAGLIFYKGQGCNKCDYTGYKGRVAVQELLIPGNIVRDAVIARKTSHEIRRLSAKSTGLVTLLEDGINKATSGVTSFHEVIRQLPRLDKPRPVPELKRMLGEV